MVNLFETAARCLAECDAARKAQLTRESAVLWRAGNGVLGRNNDGTFPLPPGEGQGEGAK